MNQTAESLWFVFYKDELLLEKEGNGTFAIPCGEIPPILIKDKTTVHNITTLEGRNCKAYSVSQPIEETKQYAMIGLRASYEYLSLGHYQAAGKAHEMGQKQSVLLGLRHSDGTKRIHHETLSELWP